MIYHTKCTPLTLEITMNKKISEQELILNNAKKAKIISFDLFDTVILRPFAKPKDVFEYKRK